MAGERKAIFITGGASGIGLATARLFASKGWFVGLADIDAGGLKAALAQIGADNGVTLALDVCDRDQWDKAIAKFAKASGGRMDVLLNNAGIARFGWFEEITPEESDQIVAVNVNGVINGARAGLDLLKATPGSRLVNVASCAGLYGAPKLAVYSATKFAVKGLSEALDIEYSRFGVGVRCIMPWFIETPILDAATRGSNTAIRDALDDQVVYTPQEAAGVIWEAAHGKDLHYTVGKRAGQMRTMARFLPGSIRKALTKQQASQA